MFLPPAYQNYRPRNAVDDVSFLEFLNICHHLRELTLAGCPASFKAGYRASVRRLLLNLITLDGIPVAQDEHDVGNSDYDDDDDDDDDDGDEDVTGGAVGGEYPNRVSSVPGFRCDTVLRPLGSRPDFVTRGGQVDGSGSNGLPRRNVTDRDQEKDEGATALDTSSASYGADSPSCSTSAHHTYTRLRSTQSTNSDSTLVQNRKKHPPGAAAMKRPATVLAVPDASMNNPHGQLRSLRPFSAAGAKDEGDVCEMSVPDPRWDSPSSLTSGMVVCGNFTAALRSRRKRHDAWTEEHPPSALEPRRYIPEIEVKQPCDKIVSAEEEIGVSPESWLEETEKTASELLEESKCWRKFYAAYRSEKRLLWEEEDEEEKLNEVETETRNTKTEQQNKSANVLKGFQSTAPLCCPHLFIDQKPRQDTS